MNNLPMREPDLFQILIDTYFAIADKEKEPYLVPELALAIGFNRSHDITTELKRYEKGDSTYPEQSIHSLMRAVTKIEASYVKGGLKGKFPVALLKFCLGAYHDLQEKEPVNTNPLGGAANQQIQIVFKAPENELSAPSVTPTNVLVSTPSVTQTNAMTPQSAQPVIDISSL